MTGISVRLGSVAAHILPPLVAAVLPVALLLSATADAAPRASVLGAGVEERTFSTYLGGQEWDEATGVATDRVGHILVSGFTLSTDYPVVGPTARGHAGITDAFVTQVSSDGSRIRWSTHLGGADLDTANALTTDRAGNVYVTGRTGSRDFPVKRALQRRLAGKACTGEPCHDAFLAKLSPDGVVRWATYFGGTGNEEPFGIAVDPQGAVYIAGATDSRDLPVTNAVQRTFQSSCAGELPCPYDAFVTKLAPNGGRVLYSTYLGGKAGDVARALVVDPQGRAYVAGSTGSPDFPTQGAVQGGTRGKHCGPPPGEPCRQAFVTKLNPAGDRIAYSTYLGGQDHDDAYGIAIDAQNRAHVTGTTASNDFPTRNAAQSALNAGACTSTEPQEVCGDAFVTKLTRSGDRLAYSTYLGGQAEDQGLTIDTTDAGSAVIGGRTDSVDFPTTATAAQHTFGGVIDGFATELARDGRLRASTFLGGTDADRVTGITAARGANTHVVGRTLSHDLPVVGPLQPALKDDDYDAFAATLR